MFSSTNNVVFAQGNDDTNLYTFDFPIQVETDIVVKVRNITTETVETLELSDDYTVTLNKYGTDGGFIVLIDADQDFISPSGYLDLDYEIMIKRAPVINQELNLRNSGAFFPEVHENRFDRQTYFDLDFKEQLERSLKFSEFAYFNNSDLKKPVLPKPEADLYLCWSDDDGTLVSRESRVDLSNYYQKAEVDNLIENSINAIKLEELQDVEVTSPQDGEGLIYDADSETWKPSPTGAPVSSVAGKTGEVILDKDDVGLDNVDNTSDENKPVSLLQQEALDDKADITSVYDKTNTDALLDDKADKSNTYTEAEVDNLLDDKFDKDGKITEDNLDISNSLEDYTNVLSLNRVYTSVSTNIGNDPVLGFYNYFVANDILFCTDNSGTIKQSTDEGSTWTTITSPTSNEITQIYYGLGLYVLVVPDDDEIYYSNDLSSWTAANPNVAAGYSLAPEIASNDSVFLFVTFNNSSGEFISHTTSDFSSIDSSSTFTNLSAPSISRVKYGDGNFAALSEEFVIFSSDLGTTWNDADTLNGGFSQPNLVYGKGVWLSYSYRTGEFSYSEDLTNWTTVSYSDFTASGFDSATNGVAFDGNLFIQIAANSGEAIVSYNGIDWETFPSTAGGNIANQELVFLGRSIFSKFGQSSTSLPEKFIIDFTDEYGLIQKDSVESTGSGGGAAEFFDVLEYGDGSTTDYYLGDGNAVESKNQLDVFVGGLRMTSNGYELNAAKDTVIFPYAIEGPVGDTPATSVYIRGIKSIPQELVGTSNVTLRSFTGGGGVASFDTGIDIQSPNQVIAFIGSAPQFGRISTSGSVVTFDNPPYDGAEINIVILGVVEIGKPSENTVGSNEIQNSVKNEMSPIGSVIAFAGAAAPNKYLICDGSEVSRSTYSDLFSILSTTYGAGDGSTTFNLPDLRGEFVRGLDGGRGVDSGRTLGSAQSDELASHRHSISSMRQRTAGGSFVNRWSVESGTHYTNYTGGDETRPRNIAMNYIIKAEY